MSKLHGLVAFLALWAFVASSPINEEKRKDEVVNLLRELLLVDLEDELNLETSKRFWSSDPTVSEPVYTAVIDMRFHSKYSYVALRLSSDLEWQVAGTGMSLPQDFTFSEETMKGTLDEIRSKYMKRQQPSAILLQRGYLIDVLKPFAFILWVPDNLGVYAKMEYLSSCDPLMDKLEDRTSIPFGVYRWENEDDIDYSILFVEDN